MAGARVLWCWRRQMRRHFHRPSGDGLPIPSLGTPLFRTQAQTRFRTTTTFLKPLLNPTRPSLWPPLSKPSLPIPTAVSHKTLHNLKLQVLHEFQQLLKSTSVRIPSSHSPGVFLHRSLRKLATVATLSCARSQVIPRLLAVATLAHQTSASATASSKEDSPFPIRFESSQPHHPTHLLLLSFLFSLTEFLILILRATYLVVLFTPAIVLSPFADSCGAKFRKRWISLVHFSLENAGAAFIKWGQWAAARPDLFPRDLCAELASLHSKAPAHKYAVTKQVIEGAFGRKVEEIFEDFEEEPVASGSIAQIHRAVLRYRYPGQMSKPMVVAVKVRHPGVSTVIRRDFTIINWCAKLSNFFPGLAWLRLDESIQQFAVFMLTQVDLAREAAHLSRFIYNFRRWKDVSFPRPLYPLVHPAVLVETFEQGESVARFVDRRGKNRLNTALASIGTHTLLKMLLVDNFIHADLHPGNILVRIEPGAPNKQLFQSRPHVVFLDVGMTAELNVKDRSTLLDFFKAIAQMDGRMAAECTLKFSRAQSCPNPGAFIDDVDKIFQFWDTEEGDALHAGQCMQELLEQVRRHKVNIEGDVCTVMVTTLVLEGWQRKLDPEFNIMDTLRQLLVKADWAKSFSYTMEGVMAP